MDEIRPYAGIGGVPAVLALVELVKRVWPELPSRWYPLVALVVGVAISEVVAALLGTDPGVAAFTGLLSGLSAGGLFSGTKAAIVEPRQEQKAVAERLEAVMRRG